MGGHPFNLLVFSGMYACGLADNSNFVSEFGVLSFFKNLYC